MVTCCLILYRSKDDSYDFAGGISAQLKSNPSCLSHYNVKGTSLFNTLSLAHYRHNTLRPRQNGRHFADDDFKRIFLNENVWISIDISLKFISKGPIDNIPALVPIMAWRRSGDKPLSEPMIVRLPTHICVTRPQWVNTSIILITIRLGNGLVPARHLI